MYFYLAYLCGHSLVFFSLSSVLLVCTIGVCFQQAFSERAGNDWDKGVCLSPITAPILYLYSLLLWQNYQLKLKGYGGKYRKGAIEITYCSTFLLH